MLKILIKEHFCKVIEGPRRSLLTYWEVYGGLRALLNSVYLLSSLAISCIVTTAHIFGVEWNWAQETISIFPGVLGFSLGGYAMLVGFGDANFLEAMRGKNEDGSPSPYMKLNGTFVHFIIIQSLSLFLASLTRALGISDFTIVFYVGSALFFYSLLTIVATALAVLNFASWFDKFD
ncbi:hypothetical protein [Oleidesulfovibrio alaskensis]|uniref:hypothetical protein n=1 Tax=Oleidesulfovibrio alaskensis TaxID=58180 RepID=UPI001A442D84|nr:hypothetical protein [Oleidesulfovibrio alaskensis]MBL3580872.1 hypothetical protein [Oleidesulfovibrio alaskensis]